jgi:DNA (cytosine-5)-methyltransferase 1
MNRPRLLDLFSGAGGAAMGYHRAGFDVTGVDIEPQPNYPFPFVKADVFNLAADELWLQHDAIHASPPCQDHIRGGTHAIHGTGWMLGATRSLLLNSGLPWVLENVPGAPMRADYQLCGCLFGLTIRRQRWFETSWHGFDLRAACDHRKPAVGIYGHPHGQRGAWPGMLPGSLETWSEGMGIDWMTAEELTQAIPPAYTEYIGRQLIETIRR